MKKSVVLYGAVFLGGVICANLLGMAFARELGAVNTYFLNRYRYTDIQGRELFLFLFYERVPRFLVLLFLSIGVYGTIIVEGYICCLGFSVGFLFVISIMNYGMKGILLMLAFFLPQWLFYAPVIMIWNQGLLHYKRKKQIYSYRGENKRQYMKYAAAFFAAAVLMGLGLFVESYVNSLFLQKVIGMM